MDGWMDGWMDGQARLGSGKAGGSMCVPLHALVVDVPAEALLPRLPVSPMERLQRHGRVEFGAGGMVGAAGHERPGAASGG